MTIIFIQITFRTFHVSNPVPWFKTKHASRIVFCDAKLAKYTIGTPNTRGFISRVYSIWRSRVEVWTITGKSANSWRSVLIRTCLLFRANSEIFIPHQETNLRSNRRRIICFEIVNPLLYSFPYLRGWCKTGGPVVNPKVRSKK